MRDLALLYDDEGARRFYRERLMIADPVLIAEMIEHDLLERIACGGAEGATPLRPAGVVSSCVAGRSDPHEPERQAATANNDGRLTLICYVRGHTRSCS